jgi:hypothetical protein
MSTERELKELFTDFLHKAVEVGGAFSKPEYHAIFSCGTIVRFMMSDPNPEFKFDKDHGYEVPKHRIKTEKERNAMINGNKSHFKSVLEKANKDIHPIIHTAYQRLVSDGYPFPGGAGADRSVYPFAVDTGFVYFSERDIMLFNMIVPAMKADTMHKMSVMGGEARRMDYMAPELILLISPTLEILFDDTNRAS